MTLIEILKRIASVMEQVAKMGKPLDMRYWYMNYETIEDKTTVHTCNTPACAAGWAALDPDLKQLIEDYVDSENPINNYDLRDPDNYPINLRNIVTKKFWEEYAERGLLGYAIFGAESIERERSFRKCFPDVDHNQFKHLMDEDPTPKDVIELLTFIIEHLETNHAN